MLRRGEDLDEHFLRHLFGVLRLENHPDGDVVNPRLMPQDQLFQRRSVAALGSCHQLDILIFVAGDFGKGIGHDRASESA